MGWTTDGLISAVEHIDLPRHDMLSRIVKRWAWCCALLQGGASAAIWTVLVYFSGVRGDLLIAVGGGLSMSLVLLSRYESIFSSAIKHVAKLAGGFLMAALCAVGLVGGAFFGLKTASPVLDAFVYGAVGAIAGLIIGFVAQLLAEILSFLVPFVGLLPGSVASLPLVWFLKVVLNFMIRLRYPEWMRGKRQIVELSSSGSVTLSTGGEAIFVAAPHLRRNGLAQQERIPKFTFAELTQKPSHVIASMSAAASVAAVAYAAGEFDSELQMQWFNPSTGLPMIGNIPGGLDVSGTAWAAPVTNVDFGAGVDFGGGGNMGADQF